MPNNTINPIIDSQARLSATGVLFTPSLISNILAGRVLQQLPANQNLPQADTRNGSIFSDRFDANLFWYLPALVPVDDIDAAFAFAAVQDGISSSGVPYNTGSLTLKLKKSVPLDVSAAQGQRPRATFQEIPIITLDVALVLVSKNDQTGADQESIITGQADLQADSTWLLSFGNIIGNTVIIAYENLMVGGGAFLSLTLIYSEWKSIPKPGFAVNSIFHLIAPQPPPFQPILPTPQILVSPVLHAAEQYPGPTPSSQTIFIQMTGQTVLNPALALKYSAGPYLQKYTITAGGSTRPILDITDLNSFKARRSEFSEFTKLVDIPKSFSQLYLGEISRTIVAIPRAYGIILGSSGCAALCQALVDTSQNSANGCRFNFTFTIAAVYDPVDLLQLSRDLAGISDVKDCTLTLPSGLDTRSPLVCNNTFINTFSLSNGLNPHSFLLSIGIADSADGTIPAVVGVNLFLQQLGSSVDTPLFGSFGIQLDDNYSPPVVSTLILNLHATSGTDDITVTAGTTAATADISNNTEFILQFNHYAFNGPNGLPPTPLNQTVPVGQAVNVVLPPGVDAYSLVVDRTLALASPVATADLVHYLTFQSQDVQQVKYLLAVNASGVNFTTMGISNINIQIALTELPKLQIQPLIVGPTHFIDNTEIMIPLDSAVTSLVASLSLTITKSQVTETVVLTNDFIQTPIFVLTDSALPVH